MQTTKETKEETQARLKAELEAQELKFVARKKAVADAEQALRDAHTALNHAKYLMTWAGNDFREARNSAFNAGVDLNRQQSQL
jgi:hypothetical protein